MAKSEQTLHLLALGSVIFSTNPVAYITSSKSLQVIQFSGRLFIMRHMRIYALWKVENWK